MSTIRQRVLTVSFDVDPEVQGALDEIASFLHLAFNDVEKRIGQLDTRSGVALMAVDIVSVKLSHSSNQSIDDDTWTTLSFNTEDYDFGNLHLSGSNTRITAPLGRGRGPYSMGALIQFASNSTGLRRTRFKENGSTLAGSQAVVPAVSGDVTTVNPGYRVSLDPGDYLEIEVHQDSGGALDVSGARFWAERIRTIQ